MAAKKHNPTTRTKTLTVDGRDYLLCFDFNAIAEAEASARLNLLQVIDFAGINASQYRALLYAALMKHQPDMTLEKTGDLIGLANLSVITDSIVEAWKLSMPDANPRRPDAESDPAKSK